MEKIELSDKHIKPRWIAAIIFLLIGAATLAYAFSQLLSPQTGWTKIEVNTAEESCAGDFVLMYNVGVSGVSARAENRAVTALYTQSAVTAYRLFHATREFEDMGNVASVNRSPNQEVAVDEALYRAFALLERYGDRQMYLGPIYETYRGLFHCTEDAQAAEFDPRANALVMAYHTDVAAFAGNPDAVQLELLGENRVRLSVSEEYLRYAEENEITAFLDFGWMKNAFIVDYLAQEMAEFGYTRGYITSYDGYMRNLDSSGAIYGIDLYDLAGQTIYPAAQMQYAEPMGLVSLRDYPLGALDSDRFYTWSDGRICSQYLDLADGLCRSAVHDLVAYSGEAGCAEILLRIAPCYIAETLDEKALISYKDVEVVYCKNRVLYYTEPDLALMNLLDQDGITYIAKIAK